ncbi:MAG: geranylgeranyl reductase family protein, partial [Anaerolineaceae bacterium]|nr:geranylgeranyl reductase family protein [Anaerolineaceae bacterium]
MKYDVIVIGAGPAGSMSAFHLAKAGKNVLVIEKQHLPRVKACAGGLTLKAQQAIPFDISPVVDVEAEGGILTFHGKPVLKVALEQSLANLVNRDEFDQFLLNHAITSGAEVIAGTKVTGFTQDNYGVRVNTEQGSYETDYLIGADGVNSITARVSGLLPKREVGYAIETELQVPPEVLHAYGAYVTFDFGALKNGYGWIFPKKDHLSVGVCYAQTAKQPGLR